MDVREKLVELLGNIYLPMMDGHNTIGEYNIPHKFKEKIADYLIANGVTVQEWISVNDRLPEPEQDVILCTSEIETYGRHSEKKKIYRNIYMGYFDGDEWLTSYCYGCEYIFRMNEKYPNETIEVTHWMPMPELPKGE